MAEGVVHREAHCMRLREQFGLRADLAWVREVAATGDSGGMVLGIPLTPTERADIEDRSRRNGAAATALIEADLSSAAGGWIDQRAGGLLHVLLAHPSPADLATVEAIISAIPSVIDLVQTPTRELQRLQNLVSEHTRHTPDLRRRATRWGIDVIANVVRVTLRTGTDPALAERLLDATGRRNVEIEYSTLEYRASTGA